MTIYGAIFFVSQWFHYAFKRRYKQINRVLLHLGLHRVCSKMCSFWNFAHKEKSGNSTSVTAASIILFLLHLWTISLNSLEQISFLVHWARQRTLFSKHVSLMPWFTVVLTQPYNQSQTESEITCGHQSTAVNIVNMTGHYSAYVVATFQTQCKMSCLGLWQLLSNWL